MSRKENTKRKKLNSHDFSYLGLEEGPSTSTGQHISKHRKKQKTLDSLDPIYQEMLIRDCTDNHKSNVINEVKKDQTVEKKGLYERIDELLAKYIPTEKKDPVETDNNSDNADNCNSNLEKLISYRKFCRQKEAEEKAKANSVNNIDDRKEKEKDQGDTQKDKSCAICLESLVVDLYVTFCGHVFHQHCIKQAVKTTKCCPYCRKRLTAKSIHPLFL